MTSNRNELAVIMPDEWQVLTQQANALVASGFLPQSVNTVQKAVAIMTLGRELGIGAWAALNGINVIQGKPTVSPQLMLAMINAKGQLEDMVITDEDGVCSVTMKRRGRTPHTAAFSMQDAAAMGLSNKDNWKKQPAIMRQWRAVAACARVVFPDVILNLYTPEEMGANVVADEQGNMTIVDVKRDEPRQLPQGEPHTTPEQPSASVSGAGIRKQEPQPEPVTHWSDDEVKLTAFYASAKERFTMTHATVDEALERFEALNIADWRAQRTWAIAALIADHCENSAERIDNYSMKLVAEFGEAAAEDLANKARQVATAVLNAEFEAI